MSEEGVRRMFFAESSELRLARLVLKSGKKNFITLVSKQPVPVLALILALCEPLLAAEIVKKLDRNLRTEALLRLAKEPTTDPDTLDLVLHDLEDQLLSLSPLVKVPGGLQKVADALNHLPESQVKEIMAGIEERQPDLAADIIERMRDFSDLLLLDLKDLRLLFLDLDLSQRISGFFGASETILSHLKNALGTRNFESFSSDLADARGKISKEKQELARKQILDRYNALEMSGKIFPRDPSETYV